MIPAGGYYVIAVQGRGIVGANHYITTGSLDLFPDLIGMSTEILDENGNLVDALATDTFFAPQLTNLPPEVAAQTGNGFWGQNQSYNIATSATVRRISLSRYRDGVDTNSTGRDFGMLPITQGSSNNILPLNTAHAVPDVNALTTGSTLPNYDFSFVGAKVIEPGVVSGFNPDAISPSPQGGKAIVAWDETGGGNAVYSKELVRSFDISAYLDATSFGLNPTGAGEWEHTAYGIGTTDGLFGTINVNGTLTATDSATAAVLTQNASTGIGWVYERYEGAGDIDKYTLTLVDFGDGGNSVPAAFNDPAQGNGWKVIETIPLETADTGWHRLGVDYNPTTGAVVATFDEETFSFNTTTNLFGTFYAGYREGLSVHAGNSRPATFDLFEEAVDNADFDDDGDVDGADFLTWQRGLGISDGSADLVDGDANDDGNVNAADLTIWRAQFASAVPAAGAVPEPAAALLTLLALGAIAATRRVH
jgi:hypothetical protein